MASEQQLPIDIGQFASSPLYRVEVKTNETSEEIRARLELEKIVAQARLENEIKKKNTPSKKSKRRKATSNRSSQAASRIGCTWKSSAS